MGQPAGQHTQHRQSVGRVGLGLDPLSLFEQPAHIEQGHQKEYHHYRGGQKNLSIDPALVFGHPARNQGVVETEMDEQPQLPSRNQRLDPVDKTFFRDC